jgi:hypothetical protein
MNEPEMDEIARLLKACVIDGTTVKDEVNRFRLRFQDVHYSFDTPAAAAKAEPIDANAAGR